MDTLFLKVLNMSISASWLVLIVLALRLLLKKSPKWIHMALWALVAVRLICPVSIESVLSLIPEKTMEQMVQSISGSYYGDAMIYSQGSENYEAAVSAGIAPNVGDNGYHYVITRADDVTKPVQTVAVLYGRIWLGGILIMLLHALISYFRLKRKVSASIDVGNGVYICDYIDTPFILGILRPKIYLPSSMEPDSASHVLAHERAHIARKDHWWKPFGYLLLSVYWFNPLLWLAYILLCRDIELACDERVIRDMEVPQKKAYSEALLSCSVNRRMIAACPLAFGEVGVKERVKTVLNYKKPAFWIVIPAVLALIVTAVCFLTDPVKEDRVVPDGALKDPYELNWLYWIQDMDLEYTGTLEYVEFGESRKIEVTYDGTVYTISDEKGKRTYRYFVSSQTNTDDGSYTDYFFLSDDPEMTVGKYLAEGDILPTELVHVDRRSFETAQRYGAVPESMESILSLKGVWGPGFYCQDSVFHLRYQLAFSSVHHAYELYRVDYHGNLLCDFHVIGIPQSIVELEDGGFAIFAVSEEDGLYLLSCYDEEGELRWRHSFEENGRCYVSALYQRNGDIYCFGEVTPENSSSDIYIWRIGLDGELEEKVKIGGSDFDSVYRVSETKNGFILYGSTQSSDGDLPLSKDGYGTGFRIDVGEDFELGRAKKAEVGYSKIAGYRKGEPVYIDDPILEISKKDRMPEEVRCGSANIFDWGDGYVVVRALNYEDYPYGHPLMSSKVYYQQTVLTGYDSKGNPLWQLAGNIYVG